MCESASPCALAWCGVWVRRCAAPSLPSSLRRQGSALHAGQVLSRRVSYGEEQHTITRVIPPYDLDTAGHVGHHATRDK